MDKLKQAEYNNIPVFYCKRCLSLKIRGISDSIPDSNYCDSCGSADIEQSHIGEWEQKYIDMYGHKYINNKSK